jgi:hypothetical protein
MSRTLWPAAALACLLPGAVYAASNPAAPNPATPAPTAPAPAFVTARASLLRAISSTTLTPGATFYLRLRAAWQQPHCTLPEGTTIVATVAALTANGHGTPQTSLALRFDPVPCSGPDAAQAPPQDPPQDPPQFIPILIALDAAPPPIDSGLKRMATAELEEKTMQSLVAPNPPGFLKPTLINDTSHAAQVFNPVGFSDTPEDPLKTGEVRGIHGIKMVLPQGDPITTLTTRHQLSLERDTQFLLYFVPAPSLAPHQLAAAQPPETPQPAQPRPTHPAPDPADIEVCAAGGCKQVADLTAPGPSSASPSTPTAARPLAAPLWTLDLAALGFPPAPDRPVHGLLDSATVSFLGPDEQPAEQPDQPPGGPPDQPPNQQPNQPPNQQPDQSQLLLTFPTHTLIPRTDAQRTLGIRPRSIRAVLLARASGHVLRELDWTIGDATGPYLWPLAHGHVLVHLGNTLVLYGPGLAPLQTFPLPGPLLFVSASPSGNLLLVATQHERHTPQQHARLVAFLGPNWPVDEDYDLTALSSTLHLIGTRRMSVEPLEPALFNAAMVSSGPTRPNHWQVVQSAFDTGRKTTLAHYTSSCSVELQALAPGQLLAQGCQPDNFRTTWYRVLNQQGATLLQGHLPPFALLQQVQSNATGTVLALASTQLTAHADLDTGMLESNLPHLTVAVYATATGKPLLLAHPAAASSFRRTLALSPAGTALAILTDSTLTTYTLTR